MDPEKALSDKAWRLSHLYKVVDPYGREVTFVPNAVQRRLQASNHPMKLILKSRQHGITTERCMTFLDDALFLPNMRCGIIAHNQPDAQTFFRDKVKYAYDHLPEEFKRVLPAQEDSARELRFANNSSLRVGTSLRSGTLQRLHVSEFGKICAKYPEKAREIVTGSFNTVHPGQEISVESTAEGRSGFFYDYCMRAMNQQRDGTRLTPLDFEFFFFNWMEDPKNEIDPEGVSIPAPLQEYYWELKHKHGAELADAQKAWYAKKWAIAGYDMKREYPSYPEEAFESNIVGMYYAKQMAMARSEHRITTVPHTPGVVVDTWWDLGINDDTVIGFTQDVGRELRLIDYYDATGEGLAHYAQILRDKAKDRGYSYGEHTPPWDIDLRELGTGKTRREQALAFGLRFGRPAPKLKIEDGIEAVRNLLGVMWFDREKCHQWVKSLEAYRKEWDEKLGTYKAKPLHDWSSHAADMTRTLATAHRWGRHDRQKRRRARRSKTEYQMFGRT